MKHPSLRKGYSLVETILYVGLCVLLVGAIVNATVLLSRSYQRIKLIKNTEMSALSVMDQMTRNIRAASDIIGTSTAYSVPSGSLGLIVPESGTDHTVRFYLSNGQVMMDKDGALLGPLTSDNVTVGSLIFRPISTVNSTGVKIELLIENEYFYNSIILRGSY